MHRKIGQETDAQNYAQETRKNLTQENMVFKPKK